MSFQKEVVTGNGVTKNIIANSQEELDAQVKAAKTEVSAVAPDINDPKDGNKIVSPPAVVDNNVEEPVVKKKKSTKKK